MAVSGTVVAYVRGELTVLVTKLAVIGQNWDPLFGSASILSGHLPHPGQD